MRTEETTSIAFFNMVDSVIEHRVCRYFIKPHFHAHLIDNSLLKPKGIDAIVKNIFKIFSAA